MSGSDVRLVLEANVRSTQLAFQHHERTLTASLRMAETLRDGVQVLAEAQADILKSFASARGFLRNASPPLALPPPKPSEPADDEDGDDDEDAPPPADDRLMAFGMAAMTFVNNLMETFRGGQGPTGAPTTAKGASFDLRSLLDWRRAVPQPSSHREPSEPTKLDFYAPLNPADMLRLASALPAELREKLAGVRAQLAPDEEKRLMRLFAAIDPSELSAIVADLTPRSVDELVTLFRAQLAKLATA